MGKKGKFDALAEAEQLGDDVLRNQCWSGIPHELRGPFWRLLLGVAPLKASRREAVVSRKRAEYASMRRELYDGESVMFSKYEREVLDQIHIDVLRMAPYMPLAVFTPVQRALQRALFIWSVRHPASGYVQGINDIAFPFFLVFLEEAVEGTEHQLHPDVTSWSPLQIQDGTFSIDAFLLSASPELLAAVGRAEGSVPSSAASSGNKGGGGEEGEAPASSSSPPSSPSSPSPSSPSSLPSSPSPPSPPSPDAAAASSPSTNMTRLFSDDSASPASQAVSSSLLPGPEVLDAVEADAYWGLTALLDSIHDNYVTNQPGIQRMLHQLDILLSLMDSELADLLASVQISSLQFAFRWMNCLLMRELRPALVARLFDTYFAEGSFVRFHVYVCAAFLIRFKPEILDLAASVSSGDSSDLFQLLLPFLQTLPTSHWTEEDVDLVLAEAYVARELYDEVLTRDE